MGPGMAHRAILIRQTGHLGMCLMFVSDLGHIISPRRAVFGQLFLASEVGFLPSQPLGRIGQGPASLILLLRGVVPLVRVSPLEARSYIRVFLFSCGVWRVCPGRGQTVMRIGSFPLTSRVLVVWWWVSICALRPHPRVPARRLNLQVTPSGRVLDHYRDQGVCLGRDRARFASGARAGCHAASDGGVGGAAGP